MPHLAVHEKSIELLHFAHKEDTLSIPSGF
jgi:hypothetical protein